MTARRVNVSMVHPSRSCAGSSSGGAVLELAHLLIVNEDEASVVAAEFGFEPTTAALHAALGIGIIRTLGSEGAEATTDQFSFRIAASRVKAVDTTAAGDCFVCTLAEPAEPSVNGRHRRPDQVLDLIQRARRNPEGLTGLHAEAGQAAAQRRSSGHFEQKAPQAHRPGVVRQETLPYGRVVIVAIRGVKEAGSRHATPSAAPP